MTWQTLNFVFFRKSSTFPLPRKNYVMKTSSEGKSALFLLHTLPDAAGIPHHFMLYKCLFLFFEHLGPSFLSTFSGQKSYFSDHQAVPRSCQAEDTLPYLMHAKESSGKNRDVRKAVMCATMLRHGRFKRSTNVSPGWESLNPALFPPWLTYRGL